MREARFGFDTDPNYWGHLIGATPPNIREP